MPNKRMRANVKSLHDTKLSEHAHFYKKIRFEKINIFKIYIKGNAYLIARSPLFNLDTGPLVHYFGW